MADADVVDPIKARIDRAKEIAPQEGDIDPFLPEPPPPPRASLPPPPKPWCETESERGG